MHVSMGKCITLLALAIVFNAVVSLLFRQSARTDQRPTLIFVGAVLLGILNALCYTKSLTKINLSVAYPVFAAASMLFICIGSCWIFRETISAGQVFGMTLIISGMIFVCAK